MLKRVLTTTAVLVVCAQFAAAQTVSVTLSSPQNGQTVQPGTTINWTISFAVSGGDNAGLALLSADLTQDAGNAATLDIPIADAVPGGMTKFARPQGLANPGTGYRGTQVGTTGAKNLLQIGGAQNTFGVAQAGGTGYGENAVVSGGIGQSGSVTLATGSFSAPSTEGAYAFALANVVANTLVSVQTPPTASPVTGAAVTLVSGSFSFTVSAGILGDCNCDGTVDSFDIAAFTLALTNPTLYASTYPGCNINLADCNQDTTVDSFDIAAFIDILTGG